MFQLKKDHFTKCSQLHKTFTTSQNVHNFTKRSQLHKTFTTSQNIHNCKNVHKLNSLNLNSLACRLRGKVCLSFMQSVLESEGSAMGMLVHHVRSLLDNPKPLVTLTGIPGVGFVHHNVPCSLVLPEGCQENVEKGPCSLPSGYSEMGTRERLVRSSHLFVL